MATFLENILAEKVKEVSQMPLEDVGAKRATYRFYDYLLEHPEKMQLIAEVKRASPSKGAIKMDVDVIQQAKSYEAAGAAAISVLTDPAYFKGNIEDLRQVASEVAIPVLCKDFIIDRKQLIRARNAGATMVLLIVAALPEETLMTLYQEACNLDLEVLVEVHNEAELLIAEKCGVKIIGVNNRDLHSFVVDIAVSERLGKKSRQKGTVYISESGFKEAADVARVAKEYQAVLVGEALMREDNPQIAAEKLKISRK